jgi:hypothetical protein
VTRAGAIDLAESALDPDLGELDLEEVARPRVELRDA